MVVRGPDVVAREGPGHVSAIDGYRGRDGCYSCSWSACHGERWVPTIYQVWLLQREMGATALSGVGACELGA